MKPYWRAGAGGIQSFAIRANTLPSSSVSVFVNPAVIAFARELGKERIFAQVVIRGEGNGWELRHVVDCNAAPGSLKVVDIAGIRQVAQFTEAGAFRPLKAAPNLAHGWRLSIESVAELGEAMDRLYPGAVADWFAVAAGRAELTDFRMFTDRQTGMYRITTFLDDEQAADVIRACCHRDFCLKRRLWTVGALPTDDSTGKSAIPCLEPCALLLELARTAARLTKDKAIPKPETPVEAQQMVDELETRLAHLDPSVREADFASPENPRRLRWLREKLARSAGKAERRT